MLKKTILVLSVSLFLSPVYGNDQKKQSHSNSSKGKSAVFRSIKAGKALLAVLKTKDLTVDGCVNIKGLLRVNYVPINEIVGLPGPKGDKGDRGDGRIISYASFYAIMPPNNATDISAGNAVEFPKDGPTSGTITRVVDSNSTFILPNIGTYEVAFQVYVGVGGQLVLGLNSGHGVVELPPTVVGSQNGNSQLVGTFFITTIVHNSVLSVRNPALANSPALEITAYAGGNGPNKNPVAATLTIKQLA